MKNFDYPLFFKANFFVTLFLYGLFLFYNNSYSLLSFLLSSMGIISTVVMLYALLYILFFIFRFSGRFVLYLTGFIFVMMDIALIIDLLIYKLYKFHINAMVINILTSPDAIDSIQVGVMPILLIVVFVGLIVIFEIFIIKRLKIWREEDKKYLNQRINKMVFLPLFLIILSEKISYGISSLFSKNEIVSKFKVIPLYQPLTFTELSYEYFGFKPSEEAKNIITTRADLNYPKHPLRFAKKDSKMNIFIFASDAMRKSILSTATTPYIEEFKKDSFVFEQHYSGGNATRFGIFSMMYGLNSTYWFSFLQANQGSVLFDVLKKLKYQISIISSTNTNWPEFRQTCYVDVQESIDDDFEGEPWEKDIQSTESFLEKISTFDKQKPIFSFLFLDAPHGYSFPPDENIFKAEENVNYLRVDKDGKEIKSLFAGYKNAIHHNDKLLGKMLQELKNQKLYEESLIIVTSDHGQEFYEYGSFGHNSAFSKAQIHTPFIIKLPKSMKNHVSLPASYPQTLTSHNDIVPTLLSLLGIRNPSSDFSNGKNLFTKDFKRRYIFTSNWNNNAILTEDKTYLFSNLPNKMFKNEVRETSNYQKVKGKIDSNILLKVMNENRSFLK